MTHAKSWTESQKIAEATGYHAASIRRMMRQGVKFTPKKIAELKAKKQARKGAPRVPVSVPVPEGAEWLFRDQAASVIGVCARTIDRMVAQGQLYIDKDRARRNQPSIEAKLVHQHARAKHAGKR